MHATSYIITYRATDDPARRANLEAVLAWLKLQPLAEVIVVEQDVAPTLGDLASFPNLLSLFAYNPGPFNKSWGFNVGVRASRGSCLPLATPTCSAGDCRRRSLRRGPARRLCGRFRRPSISTRPNSDMLRVDLSCLGDPSFGAAAPDRTEIGEFLPMCGGLVLFQRQSLALLGGWDERFLGWGCEDDAMDLKVSGPGCAG